jgi:hypothetical protein
VAIKQADREDSQRETDESIKRQTDRQRERQTTRMSLVKDKSSRYLLGRKLKEKTLMKIYVQLTKTNKSHPPLKCIKKLLLKIKIY